MKPALSEEQLDERLQRDFAAQKNSMFKNSLGKLLPSKLIPVIVELSEITPDKQVNEVTRQERHRRLNYAKDLTCTVKKLRDFPEAIVTGGGISVRRSTGNHGIKGDFTFICSRRADRCR